ncbi:hypothetical protein DFJ74DRAFT_711753 [Hyaloraphidium curvatum]|nr:hypothetical protein DFJ74DRAFT_711753 [Hyaloraphidium curvatum]
MESSVACEQPATPSLFSAAEWAALFPAPLPEPADAADVASELREIAANAAADGTGAPPLGPEELLAGLAGAPAVRLLVRLGAFLGRVVLPRYGILRIAQQAFTLFFVALIWIENDGRFGTRQLVVATVAHVRLAIWDFRATKAVAEVTRAVAVTGMLAEAVGLLIVLIGSSCIPAYNLGGLLLTITVVFVNDLVILAAANTSPDRIAALYCTAAQSLRTIGMSAVADGRPEVAAAAQWHDRILTGFADVDPYRARAFGIPVTFDLIRTMVATLFTLGVGLWSVLRGAGVGVTIDLVCPSPSSVG